MITNTCTADQIVAAAGDFIPIGFGWHMIGEENNAPEVQQAAMDSAHHLCSLASSIAAPTRNKW